MRSNQNSRNGGSGLNGHGRGNGMVREFSLLDIINAGDAIRIVRVHPMTGRRLKGEKPFEITAGNGSTPFAKELEGKVLGTHFTRTVAGELRGYLPLNRISS